MKNSIFNNRFKDLFSIHSNPVVYVSCLIRVVSLVQAGREERGKFGRKDGKMNPHASTSNKDKRKNKNYMMMKHKIRQKKTKRSFQEKQVRCCAYICFISSCLIRGCFIMGCLVRGQLIKCCLVRGSFHKGSSLKGLSHNELSHKRLFQRESS